MTFKMETIDLEKRLTLKRFGIGLGTLFGASIGFSACDSSKHNNSIPNPKNIPAVEKYLIHLTGREKPQEVSEMQYDISDNKGVAKGSARDFARTEALRYFERFHEPNIAEELSALIKNSNLYSNLTPAETKQGISTYLASKPGKVELNHLIEEHIRDTLFKQIKDAKAVAIPQSSTATEPKYKIFVFPRIFDSRTVEINGEKKLVEPNSGYIKATILGAYYRKSRLTPNNN